MLLLPVALFVFFFFFFFKWVNAACPVRAHKRISHVKGCEPTPLVLLWLSLTLYVSIFSLTFRDQTSERKEEGPATLKSCGIRQQLFFARTPTPVFNETGTRRKWLFLKWLCGMLWFSFPPPPIPYLSIHDRNVPPVSVLVAIEWNRRDVNTDNGRL